MAAIDALSRFMSHKSVSSFHGNRDPLYLFVFTQFRRGKCYALFPGKPLTLLQELL